MNLFVKNRDQVEGNGIALAEPYALISISCPGDPANIPQRKYCIDILRLEFDDLDQPIHLLGGHKYKLFERIDAKKILDFYEKQKGKVDFMGVHCDAGISRSPAVAAALTKIQGDSDHDYFQRYYPNRRVYSLLLSEYFENESGEKTCF